MSMTSQRRQQLRGKAHGLSAIVIIGQHGLTESVQTEINRALTDHELIKVKVGAEDHENRKSIIESIVETQKAELVQTIGHTAVFYRRSPKLAAAKKPAAKPRQRRSS